MPQTFTVTDTGRREYAWRQIFQAGDIVEIRVNGVVEVKIDVPNARRYDAAILVSGNNEEV